jgi:phosphoribosylamine--glycine ligase
VREYNYRFGDTETQVVIPRLASDLAAHCSEAATGRLTTPVRFSDDACVTVVVASEDYPIAPRTGDEISGLEAAAALEGVHIFHAGTVADGDAVRTAGGRVLNVTAVAPTLGRARDRAYQAVELISWPGMQFRHDIAGTTERP